MLHAMSDDYLQYFAIAFVLLIMLNLFWSNLHVTCSVRCKSKYPIKSEWHAGLAWYLYIVLSTFRWHKKLKPISNESTQKYAVDIVFLSYLIGYKWDCFPHILIGGFLRYWCPVCWQVTWSGETWTEIYVKTRHSSTKFQSSTAGKMNRSIRLKGLCLVAPLESRVHFIQEDICFKCKVQV